MNDEPAISRCVIYCECNESNRTRGKTYDP
jgi:hypothetical protein